MLVNFKQILGLKMILLFIGLFFLENSPARAESYINELEDSWMQPVEGRITDTFGTRNGKHKGIDIAAPEGEKIVSVSDGKVTKSYYSTTYGHVVFVGHPEGYETVYAHLSKREVDEGQVVRKGQEIGIIGNTGVSSGTHLHFELHKGEWTYEKEHAVDPIFVFDLPNSTVYTDQTIPEKKQELKKLEEQPTSFEDEDYSNESYIEQDMQEKVITVMKGDTLWRLSHLHKVPVKSLKDWNKLETDVIYPGQELKMYVNNENRKIVKAENK